MAQEIPSGATCCSGMLQCSSSQRLHRRGDSHMELLWHFLNPSFSPLCNAQVAHAPRVGMPKQSVAQVRWNIQEKCDPGFWEQRKLLLLLSSPRLTSRDGNLAATSCKCPWQGRSYARPSLRTAASRRALPAMPALCASQQRCFLRIPFFFLSSPPFWMLADKKQSNKTFAELSSKRPPSPHTSLDVSKVPM